MCGVAFIQLCLFFCLDGFVNGLGGFLTGAHSQNDGSGTGNSIAAGIDERAAGQAIGAIGDDTAVLIGIQAGGSGTDQRVGAGAQSHDHGIHIQLKLAALLDDGAAAAGSIGFTQLHLHAGHALHAAVFIAQNLDRVGAGTTAQYYIEGSDDWDFAGLPAECVQYKNGSLAVQDLVNGNLKYVIIDAAPAACITEAINAMQ